MTTLQEQESIVALATALAQLRGYDSTNSNFKQSCELLREIQQLLFHHKMAFGTMSSRFQQGCEEFVLLCNTVAMQALQQLPTGIHSDNEWISDEAFTLCAELLSCSELHTRRTGYLHNVRKDDDSHITLRLDLRLISLNNLACFNKQVGQPLVAIQYLEEALEILVRKKSHEADACGEGHDECSIALTHLNLCAVLSQLKRHKSAAEHARTAIKVLNWSSQSGGTCKDVNMLLVAFYNLAVEFEHQNDFKRSIAQCERALKVARTYGLDHTHDVVRLLLDMSHSNEASAITDRRAITIRHGLRVQHLLSAQSSRYNKFMICPDAHLSQLIRQTSVIYVEQYVTQAIARVLPSDMLRSIHLDTTTCFQQYVDDVMNRVLSTDIHRPLNFNTQQVPENTYILHTLWLLVQNFTTLVIDTTLSSCSYRVINPNLLQLQPQSSIAESNSRSDAEVQIIRPPTNGPLQLIQTITSKGAMPIRTKSPLCNTNAEAIHTESKCPIREKQLTTSISNRPKWYVPARAPERPRDLLSPLHDGEIPLEELLHARDPLSIPVPRTWRSYKPSSERKSPTKIYNEESQKIAFGNGYKQYLETNEDSNIRSAKATLSQGISKQPTLLKLPQARINHIARPDRLGLLRKPTKPSGFCRQCAYDGRSCKVSDCLKHQAIR